MVLVGLGLPLCPGSGGKVRAQEVGYRPLPAGEPMPVPNGLSPAPPSGTTSTGPAVSSGIQPERSASGNGSLRLGASGTLPSGSVTVETIGPATVIIGMPLTYEVVARNQTSTALGN